MTLPRILDLTKRQKFVIATLVLALGIVLSRLGMGVWLSWRFRVLLFAIFSGLVTLWAIHDEDFSGVEWLTLPILPIFFAVAALLTVPLLPVRIEIGASSNSDTALILGQLIMLVFLGIFIIGYYASLLMANIFNVAAIRSIQLLRVAHSVGFLLTVLTALFFFLVIASLHLPSFLIFLTVGIVSFGLSFQSVWSVNIRPRLGREEVIYPAVAGLILGQIAWVLAFWPVGISVAALFLTAIFYELLGIIQYELGEKLNARLANEFIVVAVVVFLLTVLTTRWGV